MTSLARALAVEEWASVHGIEDDEPWLVAADAWIEAGDPIVHWEPLFGDRFYPLPGDRQASNTRSIYMLFLRPSIAERFTARRRPWVGVKASVRNPVVALPRALWNLVHGSKDLRLSPALMRAILHRVLRIMPKCGANTICGASTVAGHRRIGVTGLGWWCGLSAEPQSPYVSTVQEFVETGNVARFCANVRRESGQCVGDE